jgi:enoyl-CoA hydratase/carnithine racemase
MAGVRDYARELASFVSPRSTRVIKRQVWDAQCQTLADATAVAHREMELSLTSADFKEGVAHLWQNVRLYSPDGERGQR